MRIACWILLFTATLSAQPNPVFVQPPVNSDLSQGHVNTIFRDGEGLLWIGTQDGLNRFDGYSVYTYLHDPDDSTSLRNNFVWSLLTDSRDQLWIGTYGGGLNRLDRTTGRFRSFHPVPLSPATVDENSVRTLLEFPAGILQLGTERGLQQFDLASERFLPPPRLAPGAAAPTAIFAIQPLDDRHLLLGTMEGLYRFDTQTRQLAPVVWPEIPLASVRSLIKLDDEIWVGRAPGLLRLRYDIATERLQLLDQLTPLPDTDDNRVANTVISFHLDQHGYLWLGSLAGLHYVDTRTSPLVFHHRRTEDGLSDGQINAVLEVEPGVLWAGTRQGIDQWSNTPLVFRTLDRRRIAGLCSDVMLGMAQDAQGTYWLGTREGLVRQPSLTDTVGTECLTPATTPGMGDAYIINVDTYADEVWATFYRGGVGQIVVGQNGGWQSLPIPGLAELTNNAGIHDLLFDADSIGWVATPNRGVVRWDRRSDLLTSYEPKQDDSTAISSPYVFHLVRDHDDYLWASTANGGVCRMDTQTGTFDCYLHDPSDPQSLSNNLVLSSYVDSQGRIWMATANGLNLWLGDSRFRRFTQKDGLPNDFVYGLIEDKAGYLWVSTNNGLCRLQLAEGQVFTQSYNVSDGLQGNEFNQYSFLRAADGTLCFGGTGGLTYFDPAQIRPDTFVPRVVLTDFQLFNRSVPVDGRFLKAQVGYTDVIILPHNQNFVAFSFAAPGYAQTDEQTYAYQLVGLDPEWVYSDDRRFASYPDLAPGQYTFRVKAANHDGIWSDAVTTVDLIVRRPWWTTWWAYLLYAVLAAGLVWGIIRLREKQILQLAQAKAAERERFRKRTARDFHDEAGNRLTKLSLLTEVIKQQHTTDATLLAKVEANVQALRSSMRDFIWVLDPRHDTLHETLLRLREFGSDLFEHTDIRFTAEGMDEKWESVILTGNERRHVLLIFQEAMHNTVRHAGAQHARLSVRHSPAGVLIDFKDDGVGFDTDTSPGNGRRNMAERAQKIEANWWVESAAGKGTQLTLRLKSPPHSG